MLLICYLRLISIYVLHLFTLLTLSRHQYSYSCLDGHLIHRLLKPLKNLVQKRN